MKLWVKIVIGVVAAFVIIGVIAVATGPKSATTAAAPAPVTTAVAAPAAASPPGSTMDPGAASALAALPTDPAAAARAGCAMFTSHVAPVLGDAVQSDDLAPAIRVTMGLPPDVHDTSGESITAPWNVTNLDFTQAATDPRYQPLVDDLNALDKTITQADPGGPLSAITTGEHAVTAQCQALHAL